MYGSPVCALVPGGGYAEYAVVHADMCLPVPDGLTMVEAAAMPDLSKRELACLVPIAAAVFWMGIYPESFMAPMRKDVSVLLERVQESVPASDSRLVVGAPPAAADAHGAAEAGH